MFYIDTTAEDVANFFNDSKGTPNLVSPRRGELVGLMCEKRPTSGKMEKSASGRFHVTN